MFSQTAEYALRAVVWLAEQPQDTRFGVNQIAAATQVPASYLAKILQQLARAELVDSRRGVGGGFSLAVSPQDLTVLNVINIVDPICRIHACPLHLPAHKDSLCPMHARMDEALATVEEALGESTIADILSDESFPVPLQNRAHR